jgi:hypothetical protein
VCRCRTGSEGVVDPTRLRIEILSVQGEGWRLPGSCEKGQRCGIFRHGSSVENTRKQTTTTIRPCRLLRALRCIIRCKSGPMFSKSSLFLCARQGWSKLIASARCVCRIGDCSARKCREHNHLPTAAAVKRGAAWLGGCCLCAAAGGFGWF